MLLVIKPVVTVVTSRTLQPNGDAIKATQIGWYLVGGGERTAAARLHASHVSAVHTLGAKRAHRHVKLLVGRKIRGADGHRLVRDDTDNEKARRAIVGRRWWRRAARGNTKRLAHVNPICIADIVRLSDDGPAEAIAQTDAI